MQYPFLMMESTRASVVRSFHVGKCFQRGGGWVGGSIGISAGWMSNTMLRLKVIVHSCGLLARFGLVRLLFVLRHVRCLSLGFLLTFLIGGIRAVSYTHLTLPTKA